MDHPAASPKERRDDALILSDGVFEGKMLHARMSVLGLDGKLGEFCGNGARAVASYLFVNYPEVSEFFLKTPHGVHPLKKHPSELYSITLPHPKFECSAKFISNWPLFKQDYEDCHYVEILEPHLVIKKKMKDEELFAFGRKLNRRKDLFPLGINVNACHVLDFGLLYVKTYERGVQRLTRSCGTGSIASACLHADQGSILVLTPGGLLEITLLNCAVELKGPAFFLR